MIVNIEKTDTFGGEPNYCWIERHSVTMPDSASDLAIMRKAKELCGYNGLRGRVYKYGDMIEFRPYRVCQVMFITFESEVTA
jgi:hypothetical protein